MCPSIIYLEISHFNTDSKSRDKKKKNTGNESPPNGIEQVDSAARKVVKDR